MMTSSTEGISAQWSHGFIAYHGESMLPNGVLTSVYFWVRWPCLWGCTMSGHSFVFEPGFVTFSLFSQYRVIQPLAEASSEGIGIELSMRVTYWLWIRHYWFMWPWLWGCTMSGLSVVFDPGFATIFRCYTIRVHLLTLDTPILIHVTMNMRLQHVRS